MKHIGFDTAVFSGSCVFAFCLLGGVPFLYRSAWCLSWLFLFLVLKMFVEKKKREALFCLPAALAFTILWGIGAEDSLRLYGILVWLAALFFLWPFRFLALGEISLAGLFGPVFWRGTACLAAGADVFSGFGIPNETIYFMFAAGSGLILFGLAVWENIGKYGRHKARQHYSLPVFLGSLSATLDRKWRTGTVSARLPEIMCRIYLSAGTAAVLLSLISPTVL